MTFLSHRTRWSVAIVTNYLESLMYTFPATQLTHGTKNASLARPPSFHYYFRPSSPFAGSMYYRPSTICPLKQPWSSHALTSYIVDTAVTYQLARAFLKLLVICSESVAHLGTATSLSRILLDGCATALLSLCHRMLVRVSSFAFEGSRVVIFSLVWDAWWVLKNKYKEYRRVCRSSILEYKRPRNWE